jgi:hypothetical protein
VAGKPSSKADVQIERERQLGAMRLSMIRATGTVGSILASALPLKWIYLATAELAGKETKLTFRLSATISLVGIAAILKAITGHFKIKQQSRELVRLRDRCNTLERQVSIMQRG